MTWINTSLDELSCVVCVQSHLTDHESVHSGCRSFVCHVCGASFKTKAVQRKHVLTIHTQPGSYVCHACGRLFNTSFAMKRHSRMHQLDVNTVDLAPAAVAPSETDRPAVYLRPTVQQ